MDRGRQRCRESVRLHICTLYVVRDCCCLVWCVCVCVEGVLLMQRMYSGFVLNGYVLYTAHTFRYRPTNVDTH